MHLLSSQRCQRQAIVCVRKGNSSLNGEDLITGERRLSSGIFWAYSVRQTICLDTMTMKHFPSQPNQQIHVSDKMSFAPVHTISTTPERRSRVW
jgi:hypothetical protein